MRRRSRDTSPDRSPHPPGRNSPQDVSRRKFKEKIDGLLARFMLEERDAPWTQEPVAAVHIALTKKFARFLSHSTT